MPTVVLTTRTTKEGRIQDIDHVRYWEGVVVGKRADLRTFLAEDVLFGISIKTCYCFLLFQWKKLVLTYRRETSFETRRCHMPSTKTSSSHSERRTDLKEASGGVVSQHWDGGDGGDGVWPSRSCLVLPAGGATNWGCWLRHLRSGESWLWVPPRDWPEDGGDGGAGGVPPSLHG
jgi:hypothetical protein